MSVRFHVFVAALTLLPTVSVAAQTTSPTIIVSGSPTTASNCCFHSVSQSDREMGVRGGITVGHRSGVYVGVRGSNLAGWGMFGGANIELDLIVGYKSELANDATLCIGATWYTYPRGANRTDFVEPYAKLTGTVGPATLADDVACAPKQRAIGKWHATGATAVAGAYTSPGSKNDNLYLVGDGALAIASTPFTAKTHVGHSWGQDGLGPNVTAVSPFARYWDRSLGADAT